ncbi:MAG: glycosyltransferase family 39 protein [Pyrinomonadaceae bacterium]
MLRSELAKRAWLLFFIAAVLLYFYGLGGLPFVGPDEPRYVEVAREMFLRRDFITPTLAGHAWFEKPVLLYWMIMATFGAFGVSEWAARIGPACSALLSILFIYRMARRVERVEAEKQNIEKRETAGLAGCCAVALATCVGTIAFARAATFDILLVMTVTGALCCFFVAEIEAGEKRRRLLLAAFYVFVGASLLAKGLVGIVIPFGVVGAYFVLRREWPQAWMMKTLLWGVPLALIVAASWYGPVIARHDGIFIRKFFIEHHFARYVSNKYHHPQPFYFYIQVMVMLALPWTAFLAGALTWTRKWAWRDLTPVGKFRLFALAWLALPILFFSFSSSKLPAYILPSLPGAALLIGERLSAFLRGEASGKAMRATGLLLVIGAVTVIYYAKHTGDVSLSCALAVSAPLFVAGVIATIWARLRQLSFVAVVCAIFLTTALAVNCGAGAVAQHDSMRDLLALADARGYGSTPVYQLHTIEHTAEFYAAGRFAHEPNGEPLKFEGAFQVEDAARKNGGPVLVIVPVKYSWQLTTDKALTTEVIGDNGELALIAVRAR